jgi:hypothetical protein
MYYLVVSTFLSFHLQQSHRRCSTPYGTTVRLARKTLLVITIHHFSCQRLMRTCEAVSRAQSSSTAKGTLDDFAAIHSTSFLVVPEPPNMQGPSRKSEQRHHRLSLRLFLTNQYIHKERHRTTTAPSRSHAT